MQDDIPARGYLFNHAVLLTCMLAGKPSPLLSADSDCELPTCSDVRVSLRLATVRNATHRPASMDLPRNRGAEASPGLPHGLRAWSGSAVRQGTRRRFRGYPPPGRRARKVRGGFETDRHREPGQGATGISDRFCREPRQPATGIRDRFYRYSGQENRRKPAKALANLDHNFELCSQTSKEQQPAGGVADWQGDESWKHRSASKRIRCHR